jgi:NAD(P)-dependent dehydrogenase (short-subunit alcohol dehydrogenase family)
VAVAHGGARDAIIYIISVAAVRATTVLGMYGVTKAADYGLCRNLAAEWGPDNVRVNRPAPGLPCNG